MRFELAIIAICVVAFGGLGYLFLSLTSGINQPIAATPRTETVISDEIAAPPAGNLQPEGWHEIGGPSILADAAGTAFSINFNRCDPGAATIDFTGRTLTLALQGLDGNNCRLSYSFEGKDVSCDVPSSLGQLRFSNAVSPSFGSIERYCGS